MNIYQYPVEAPATPPSLSPPLPAEGGRSLCCETFAVAHSRLTLALLAGAVGQRGAPATAPAAVSLLPLAGLIGAPCVAVRSFWGGGCPGEEVVPGRRGAQARSAATPAAGNPSGQHVRRSPLAERSPDLESGSACFG